MKELLKTNNLTYVGVGMLTAFIFYNVLVNRQKASEIVQPLSKPSDDKSSFCGCGM